MKYFGGIEGGATHSHLVICNESGDCLVTTTGLGTNHWAIGIQECVRRIADMVERGKSEAHISQETPLASLGLCLSGCEQEETNRELEAELRNTFPNLAESYIVGSDTLGSVFTASAIGGMVIIAGTGSNGLLRNPDGSTYNCGGWGNFLGDEGSAWYISHRAVKIVFDDMDRLTKSLYPVEHIWELIQQHFNVKSRLDLLPHCYAKFDKSFFASLCKKLAQAAQEGDALALFLFKEAGQDVARHIKALLPKVQSDLVSSGELSIVCVGSVWHSWELMREGFLDAMKETKCNFDLKLVQITKTMAFGACYLAADAINFNLPRNYEDNFQVLYQHKFNRSLMNGCHSKETVE